MAQSVQGPLPTRDNDPTNTPFLRPSPIDASVLGHGQARFDAALDISNNFITISDPGNRRYIVDFEEQRLNLTYGRGIGRDQEIGVALPLIARDGGVLEQLIDTFHSIFGFKGGGRGNVPSGRTLFEFSNADGQTIVNRNGIASGIGDVVFEYRRRLTAGPESDAVLAGSGESSPRQIAASVRALVKLPTGSSRKVLGSGAADFGLGTALTVRPGRQLALHGNAALVFLGRPHFDNFTPRRSSLVHSLVAVEYLLTRRTSLVVQTDDNPAPIRTGIAYADRPRRQFTFGVWQRIGPTDRLFLSMSQNDFGPAAKVSPDVTLSTGMSWRLK